MGSYDQSGIKAKKRFSIKIKLLLVFGVLITVAVFALGILALQMAKRATTEKVENHLIDKAVDTAEVINGRLESVFQFLDGIARMPILQDAQASEHEKMLVLKEEATLNPEIIELNITTLDGKRHTSDGKWIDVSDRDWFLSVKQGKDFFSEPIRSRIDQTKMVAVFAVPIRDNNKNMIAILSANVEGTWLSSKIKDIKVGETGYCIVVGKTGVTIAHPSEEPVKAMLNTMTTTDARYASLSKLLKVAVASDKSQVGYYDYDGEL